ncbi:MAG: RecX family transcriptional regulator, partial [Clostridia bacterium]|nr:RecX family transcriptional regulator [Clostridia bacterium]
VDRRIIEEELAGFKDDGEQISTLLKKYMRGKEYTRENLYKACRYLVAKGYAYDDVKEACAGLEDEDN